jgi:uncharacterized coiled-coil DUF342 family protein
MKNLIRKIAKETQIIQEINYRHRRITELLKEKNLDHRLQRHALMHVTKLVDEATKLRTKLVGYVNDVENYKNN